MSGPFTVLIWSIGWVILFLIMTIAPFFLCNKQIRQYFQWVIAIGVVGSVGLMAFRFVIMPKLAEAFGL